MPSGFSPGHQSSKLRLGCNDSSIDISVSDHGIGIPMEDQEGLFQAFHRGSNAMTIQGTGLGLSIVKKAVDLLGGRISFVSAPGNGTTFKVSLPTHHG
ncbi:MAG: sensor histidine kinase [Cyclobacteriaceae bacterium]